MNIIMKLRQFEDKSSKKCYVPIYRCYFKSSHDINSSTIKFWKVSTCGFLLSCNKAHDRVPSRCGAYDDKCRLGGCQAACAGVNECNKTIYLTGKADCQGNDPHKFMAPKKICCAKHPIFTGGAAIVVNC